MSKYKLVFLGNDNNIRVLEDDFPFESVTECKKSISKLEKLLLSVNYYLIVKDNIFDLLQCIDNIDTHDKKLFTILNRYTFNFVNTFYAYINFYETNFKKVFYPIKVKYYDENIEYRLIYNIRNYMAHKEMVVSTVVKDILSKDTDSNISIQLDIKKLANKDSGVQKKVRKELQAMIAENKQLDLSLLIHNFFYVFESLQKELMDELVKDSTKSLETIDEFIEGDFPNYLPTYIINKEEPSDIISLATYMNHFLKKIDSLYSENEKYDKTKKRSVGFST